MPVKDAEARREYNRLYRLRPESKARERELNQRPEVRARRRERHRAYYRNHKYKARYGITLEQFAAMSDAQGGVCKVCGSAPEKDSLHVDHCHETGQIRGLLCGNCNRGLGSFHDDPHKMLAAIEYLRRAA